MDVTTRGLPVVLLVTRQLCCSISFLSATSILTSIPEALIVHHFFVLLIGIDLNLKQILKTYIEPVGKTIGEWILRKIELEIEYLDGTRKIGRSFHRKCRGHQVVQKF